MTLVFTVAALPQKVCSVLFIQFVYFCDVGVFNMAASAGGQSSSSPMPQTQVSVVSNVDTHAVDHDVTPTDAQMGQKGKRPRTPGINVGVHHGSAELGSDLQAY